MSLHIDLKKLEKNLGLKLKRNSYCVGIDLASVTGIAIIETTTTKATIDLIQFKIPKIENPTQNIPITLEFILKFMRDFLPNLKKSKAKTRILVIENAYLGCNPYTFGLLRMFAGIAFAVLFDYFNEIKLMPPTTSRKMVGMIIDRKLPRKQKKQYVIDFVNKILETELTSDDEADAVIYSINGLVA